MELHLTRLEENDKQTIGVLQLIDNNNVLFSCYTLELPYIQNQRNVSCIPLGKYNTVLRTSFKFGNHLHITNVYGRSYILIHSGNFNSDIRGCVIIGSSFKDINSDGYADVVNSKRTLKKLMAIVPNDIDLVVR